MWSATNDEQDCWRLFCVRRCLALAGGYPGKNGMDYESKTFENLREFIYSIHSCSSDSRETA